MTHEFHRPAVELKRDVRALDGGTWVDRRRRRPEGRSRPEMRLQLRDPGPDLLVEARRREHVARREHCRRDGVLVPREDGARSARNHLPGPRGPVSAGGQHGVLVVAEGRAEHVRRVKGHDRDGRSRAPATYACGAVAARRHENPGERAEGRVEHAGLYRAAERPDEGAELIPDHCVAVGARGRDQQAVRTEDARWTRAGWASVASTAPSASTTVALRLPATTNRRPAGPEAAKRVSAGTRNDAIRNRREGRGRPLFRLGASARGRRRATIACALRVGRRLGRGAPARSSVPRRLS